MCIFFWSDKEALAMRREASMPGYFLRKKWAFFFWRNAVALAGEKPTGVVPAAARAPHYPFRKNEHRPLMNWWIVFFWSKCKEGAQHTAAGCQQASKRYLNKIISVFIEEIMRCWRLIWSEIVKVLWILRNQACQPRNLFRQDAYRYISRDTQVLVVANKN